MMGSVGYGLGTIISLGAGCCYGGTALKVIRGAYIGARALKGSATAVKSLRETHSIAKLTKEAAPTV